MLPSIWVAGMPVLKSSSRRVCIRRLISETLQHRHLRQLRVRGQLDRQLPGRAIPCALLLSHDLQPVSGQSGTANRTTVRLSGSMRLWKSSAAICLFNGTRTSATRRIPPRTTSTPRPGMRGPDCSWALTKHFALKGDYAYTIYDDRDADTTAYRNKFFDSADRPARLAGVKTEGEESRARGEAAGFLANDGERSPNCVRGI